jgi:digeranylgeranylglycerophospholipid reductase
MADLRAAGDDVLRKINNGHKMEVRNLLHLSDLPMLARFAKRQLTQ